MKKRYCFVIEINPEEMDAYVALHKDPWEDTLRLLREAGAEELLIYRFRNFSGDLSGSSPSASLSMSSPRQVQATFDRVPYIAPTGVANAAGTTPAVRSTPASVTSVCPHRTDLT